MKKSLTVPVLFACILALSLTFGGCDAGSDSDSKATLNITGLSSTHMSEGHAEIVVGIFKKGTDASVVMNNIYKYWEQDVNSSITETSIVAFSDLALYGDVDTKGNATMIVYEWSGADPLPKWTSYGTYDVWLILSSDYFHNVLGSWSGSHWYFYKAASVPFIAGSATIPMSKFISDGIWSPP